MQEGDSTQITEHRDARLGCVYHTGARCYLTMGTDPSGGEVVLCGAETLRKRKRWSSGVGCTRRGEGGESAPGS